MRFNHWALARLDGGRRVAPARQLESQLRTLAVSPRRGEQLLSLGLRIAAGEGPADSVTEGSHSADVFLALLRSQHIDSPYFATIAAALREPRRLPESLQAT